MSFDLEKISSFSQEPGVYLMKNKEGDIIYIGKAKNIRSRIRSYFNPDNDKRLIIPTLIRQLEDIELILTASEHEAFLLENILIKQHQPRFNVRLRDDKDYVSIRVNISHQFPRLEIIRRRKKTKDDALYFGPYTSVKDVRETIKLIRKIFPLRNCKETMFKSRTRPCIQYEIKRCLAPCVKKISKEDYAEILNNAIMFLKGEGEELIKTLKKNMEKLSDKMEFEKASVLRDQIKAIEHSLSTQNIVLKKWDNRDIFGLASDELNTIVAIISYRNGNLVSTREFVFKSYFQAPEEIISSVIMQFYDSTADIPEEILIDREIEDAPSIENTLSEKKGRKVLVISPQRGEKTELISLAQKNAAAKLELKRRNEQDIDTALKEIQQTLKLPRIPKHIEAFDISNMQGAFAVGSMVAFKNGEPDKAQYRRYKIKTVAASNDFAMMREVIDRRYKRAVMENLPLPDLLLIDGGKGQLEMAYEVLNELNLTNLPVAAIAKSRPDETLLDSYLSPYITSPENADKLIQNKFMENPKTIDRFFIPGRKNPIFFNIGSFGLRLLMKVRDEAHRFAVDYHRRLMKNQRFSSVLEEIPGIGPKQKKRLLKIFGSLQAVKEANVETLMSVGNLTEDLAKKVYKFFHTIID